MNRNLSMEQKTYALNEPVINDHKGKRLTWSQWRAYGDWKEAKGHPSSDHYREIVRRNREIFDRKRR